jgi:hypothetical protein
MLLLGVEYALRIAGGTAPSGKRANRMHVKAQLGSGVARSDLAYIWSMPGSTHPQSR